MWELSHSRAVSDGSRVRILHWIEKRSEVVLTGVRLGLPRHRSRCCRPWHLGRGGYPIRRDLQEGKSILRGTA